MDTIETGLVRRSPASVVLTPVMDVKLAQQRLQELQEFCANYLQESKDGGTDGGDFGLIPGAGKKKTLFKSGADKLCDVYGLADRYTIISKVEDFDQGLFDYTIECWLVRKTDEMFVGSGLGSCSSWESKYRWREGQRVCPTCQQATIIKGKEEYGGGWLCWTKKGGCGAKFAQTDPAVIGQTIGRVENPDITDTKNTVLKMAQKRAKIQAVIGVTRTSGLFTQDLDEHEFPVEKITPVAEAAPTVVGAAQEPHGPVFAKPNGEDRVETHAEKIARVKAEAAKHKPSEPHTVGTEAPTLENDPVGRFSQPVPEVTTAADAPNGAVFVTAINVKPGPMAVKDGKNQPAWLLYIVKFSGKVTASDGSKVLDASTFDAPLAAAAETARDNKTPVKPVLEPAKKKGSFNLVRFA